MGDRIGHVTDVGGQDRRERAYRTSRELTLHTDRCDVIGMLCVTPALHGGVSGYASTHTIYNDVLASGPSFWSRCSRASPITGAARSFRASRPSPSSRCPCSPSARAR